MTTCVFTLDTGKFRQTESSSRLVNHHLVLQYLVIDLFLNPTPSPFSGLDVPIALRKGARNCLKYPIAIHLSCHRLSKVLTINVPHLFVPGGPYRKH